MEKVALSTVAFSSSGVSVWAATYAPEWPILFLAIFSASFGGLLLSLEDGIYRNIKVFFGALSVGFTTTIIAAMYFAEHIWIGVVASVLLSYSPSCLNAILLLVENKVRGK